MLPFPGAPSSSWAMYKARIQALFEGADTRVCTAFWLFGLINNVIYVVILSAALDLVGPNVPKGVVLLADVIPGFLVKLCGPYFIHAVPYSTRVMFLVCISTCGMLLIALTPAYTNGGTISTKMAGIILATLSSGAGELSFLGLTHYYGPFSLAAWGSGTGAAGLIGAGAYALATTSLGLSVKTTLLASATLPVIMLFSFFGVLPTGPLKSERVLSKHVEHIPVIADNQTDGEDTEEQHAIIMREDEGLLASLSGLANPNSLNWRRTLLVRLRRSRRLFIPYMLPLLLVYIAEYTINQGVAPTLLFPLAATPFKQYRSFYPVYASLYQAGVFISRSSIPFIRIHNLYLLCLFQVLNLAILILQSLFGFLPNVWWVFAIVFWEGLLGGAVYVNTFAEIGEKVRVEDREFSLGATSVSDSAGICVAGFLGMGLEKGLCGWQVGRGRDWCRRL